MDRRNLPVPASRKTDDVYNAYRHYCSRGVQKPAQSNTFIGNIAKRPGAVKSPQAVL